MTESGLRGFLDQILEALTSPVALWVYSWAGIILVLLVAILISIFQLRILKKFDEAKILKRYRGREPEKPESIQKRINELEAHAAGAIRGVSLRSIMMIASGVVIPASMLIFVAWYQNWFISGAPALIVANTPSLASEIEPLQLVAFSIDQALRGGLSDLFEVFGLSVTQVSNNPDNLVFSGLVLGFRALCGAVALGIAWLILRVGLGMRSLRAATQKLEGDLIDALASSTAST
tara:strand:- start:8023 stop:8724 length:702 start_codon:yes stop_codon:yes gene_type:complete